MEGSRYCIVYNNEQVMVVETEDVVKLLNMCKAIDKSMVIGELALWEKTGGSSGTYRRAPEQGK